MKSCGQCGFSNDDSMRFCLECGTALGRGPQMVVPLNAASGEVKPSEQKTDSFEDPTVVANRLQSTVPSDKRRGGRKALKIILGIVIGAVLLVVVASAGVVLAVYLAIINADPQPLVQTPKPPPLVSTTPRVIRTPRSTPPEFTPSPTPTVDPDPGEATKRAAFSVNTDEEWQVSNIRTVEKENFSVRASGTYDLDGIRRNVTARGVSGHTQRRVFKQFNTGALLMRTHYPDGTHSNIQAVSNGQYWQNYPDEKGNLEFMINDNEPDENSGNLKISFEMTKGNKD